jgi:phosphatidylserine/phosphatidylglycerophosphate/cardiolipin synthase-like enzyme
MATFPTLVRVSSVVAFALAVGACGGDDPASDTGDLKGTPLVEGSPEALGVLAMVNDASTTLAVLKGDAKVESRAAANIVAHRDGADAAAGTEDDDLFDAVKELDDIKYVGAATLQRLLDYAKKNGWVSDGATPAMDVIFSPQSGESTHTARVAKVIDSATKSIDIAMYSFSDAGISAALDRAVKRGVDVRFLFETAGADKKLTGTALESSKSGKLEKIGVDVRWVNKIMHHKFMIVDGPRDEASTAATAQLVSGSGNWSSGAATKYDENTIFMSGQPELALRVQREFNLLWEHSGDLVANASLTQELSTLTITDELVTDEPDVHVYFTSANFSVKNTTFSTLGSNEVADQWVAAIKGAKKSIHVASGHLRSRPIAEALMAKIAESPEVDVKVYLDGQEYLSEYANDDQQSELADCLAAAGTSESKKRGCLDKGFLFGLDVGEAGADVRYKYYAYRWDTSYAAQMHHKYVAIDGEKLLSGSYNLSDNAEHNTFENMFVFEGERHADLVDAFEANFAKMWETGRAEGLLAELTETIQNEATIPIVFPSMALTWQEVTTLKQLIRSECPDVDSTEFRQNAATHQTCTK